MELTAVVGKTSSSEQILGHQLTFLRLSSNIAGAFEDVSVCTLLFGERERKLDYVTSPVFNKLYIESSCGGTGVCLISLLTSNPVFIWVSNLIFLQTKYIYFIINSFAQEKGITDFPPENIQEQVYNPFFKKPDKHEQKGKKSNKKQTSK